MVTIAILVSLVGADYDDARARLQARQVELSRRYQNAEDRVDAILAARREVERAVVEELLPAWLGTTWDFYGTSQVPGEGTIACGYLVSTVLEHAGFAVERVHMAQQASEYIIRSLAPERVIHRFRHGDTTRVVAAVRGLGNGVYLIGLDYHVGFLVVAGDEVTFCHSSYLPPGVAVCAPAATDPAMESGYHVVGRLFEEGMMRAWLTGKAIPTVTR